MSTYTYNKPSDDLEAYLDLHYPEQYGNQSKVERLQNALHEEFSRGFMYGFFCSLLLGLLIYLI